MGRKTLSYFHFLGLHWVHERLIDTTGFVGHKIELYLCHTSIKDLFLSLLSMRRDHLKGSLGPKDFVNICQLNRSDGERICMYGDGLDLNTFLWPRLLINLNFFNVIQYLQPFYKLSKHSVLAIEVGRRCESDEKLRAIGVGPFIRHAHDTAYVVPQSWTYLIFEELIRGIVYRGRSLGLGIRGRTASLSYEIGNQAVEGTSIVIVGCAEGEEVFSRLGYGFAE